MAAAESGARQRTPGLSPADWICFPRLAERTPRLDSRSVGTARDFCLSTMRRWGVLDRGDDVAVVVSELLTNALRHAVPQAQPEPGGARPEPAGARPEPAGARPEPGGARPEPGGARPEPGGARPEAGPSRWPVRLGLLQPGRFVLCAVSDPSPRLPQPKDPDYLAESGRGLHVISALSDRWGCTTPTRAGKVVWALFAVRLDRPPAGPAWYAPARAGEPRSMM